MKAIVQNGYGGSDVLALKDVETPQIKENEILVSMRASSVNAGDVFTVKGSPWLVRFTVGFPKPKDYILGWDVAGCVEAVGTKVTKFCPGDEVFGGSSHAFAEYVAENESSFAKMPDNLTFEQAATLPTAGVTALQALRDHGKIQPGQKVLINGATGGVGLFSVQIAKALGAEVTAVCTRDKVDLVRSHGADHVIDYTRDDFTKEKQKYDFILDNVASRPYSELKKVLASNGLIQPNSGHGGMSYVFKAFLSSMFSSRCGRPFMAVPNYEDLNVLKEFCETGKIQPFIDQVFPLGDTQKAIEYLNQTHARGKVVITINGHPAAQ